MKRRGFLGGLLAAVALRKVPLDLKSAPVVEPIPPGPITPVRVYRRIEIDEFYGRSLVEDDEKRFREMKSLWEKYYGGVR